MHHPHYLSCSSSRMSCSKRVLIGSSLLALWAIAGLLAVGGVGEVRYQLERSNNILRRWRCPVGGYVAGAGSKGNCLCLKCPPGFKCVGGFEPKRPCSPGKYQNEFGQGKCVPSPPGYHVPSWCASYPTKCARGTFQPLRGQRHCVPAFPGNYVPKIGARVQTKCPVGRYQNVKGQRLCKPAPRGTYVNKVGAIRGTPCEYGTYNPLIGQIRCRPTAPGYYASRRGLRTQIRCGVNTYQHCYGQMVCVPCPIGTKAGRGARRCVGGPRGSLPQRPVQSGQHGASGQNSGSEVTVKQCVCPRIYAPMCGQDGKTYANNCVARCREVTVACKGKCPCPIAEEDALVE